MKRFLFIAASWVIVFIMAFFCVRQWMKPKEDPSEIPTVTHQMIIEKIIPMGKLELCKYFIKDVMTYEENVDWFPDRKVLMIVSGEAIGCIDLQKIDSSSILIQADKIIVTLPQPEICVYKIDHKNTRVHSIEKNYTINNTSLIDSAYKYAEANLEKSISNMDILEQTTKNAQLILKPLLEQVSGGKKVEFK